MAKWLVTVTKTAEVEVDIDEARERLAAREGLEPSDFERLTDGEIAEWYISVVEGNEMDLAFDRHILAVSELVPE